MNAHTIDELRQLQAMPLSIKIKLTQNRIREWIREYGEDGVYVSFSGGKDSTVLLDIVRSEFPRVKGCFVNTGLEYPEIVKFVKTFDNIDIIRPEMNFKQVIEKYGYPIFSKEVAEAAAGARTYLESIIESESLSGGLYKNCYDKICGNGEFSKSGKSEKEEMEELANLLNKRMKEKSGGANQRLAIMLGMLTRDKENPVQVNAPSKDRSRYSAERYKFLLNAPFRISNKCCNVMKKSPAHKYSKQTGLMPITAQMADESTLRTQKWLQNGCNAFDVTHPISNPMSFWTEQDVLEYIKEHNLPICSVYGEIVPDMQEECDGQISFFDMGLLPECRKMRTTGADRTGCMFCLFGIHMEKSPNRLERMKITHPKVYEWMMKPTDQGGLGYKEIIDYINSQGGFNIKY